MWYLGLTALINNNYCVFHTFISYAYMRDGASKFIEFRKKLKRPRITRHVQFYLLSTSF